MKSFLVIVFFIIVIIGIWSGMYWVMSSGFTPIYPLCIMMGTLWTVASIVWAWIFIDAIKMFERSGG